MQSNRKAKDVPSFVRNSTPRVGLTKADAAYAEIRNSILTCQLKPGSVIDQEMVAEWLRSSTTPVREALRRLDAEQLVVMRAHSEVRVAPTSIEEFREFHLVRVGLEPVAAEVATKMASDEQIEELRQFVFPDAEDPLPIAEAELSRTFHQGVYSASGNATVTRILDGIWDRSSRYRVILADAGQKSICATPEHQAIFNALEARDRKTIGKLVKADIESSYRKLLPELEKIVAEVEG
jgi:DNA-binding GntR family transcriptional regulator